MNDTYRFTPMPAGARTLALKQVYPGNLMWGIALASMVHLAVMATLLMLNVFESPLPTDCYYPVDLSEPEGIAIVLPPPKPMVTEPGRTAERPRITPEDLHGLIPDPVPDDQIIEEPEFPTRMDYALANAGYSAGAPGGVVGSDGGSGGGLLGGTALIGESEAPVPLHLVQELPVPIGGESPTYPEHAALLQKTATVTIRAKIDATGRVVEAEVARSTDSNSGFNEAALTAAYTRTYRPAIQNGRPVSVWIAYRVEFELSR